LLARLAEHRTKTNILLWIAATVLVEKAKKGGTNGALFVPGGQ
jgi:hypothetical protein